jgi:hypothetical protein
MLTRGMAETLYACPPIRDAAKSLPYGRTRCSERTAAAGHSTCRRPTELLAAPAPSARGANIFRNRPRSSSGCGEGPQASDVAPAAAAWGGRD